MPFKRKWKISSQESCESKMRSRTEKTAHQLYENRLLLRKGGDEKSDWESANKIVQNPVKAALFAFHTPLIKLEKRLWEPLLIWANNQALLGLLGLVGNVGIIIAVVTYIGSEKQRRNAEVLNAWQTITSAYGQAGSGGRIQALEFLNASPGANWRRKFPWVCAPHPLCVWPAESLAGINLAVEAIEINPSTEGNPLSTDNNKAIEKFPGIYLAKIQLPNADLGHANLQSADLWDANLQNAILLNANLQGALLISTNLQGTHLDDANLQNARLTDANLQNARLINTNLQSAHLLNTNLQSADLWDANLQNAILLNVNLQGALLINTDLQGTRLTNANLQNAVLWGTDFQNARLINVNLQDAHLLSANLQDAQNLTEEQITKAKLCLTQLPTNISLRPNRDCAELGIDPKTGRSINSP